MRIILRKVNGLCITRIEREDISWIRQSKIGLFGLMDRRRGFFWIGGVWYNKRSLKIGLK